MSRCASILIINDSIPMIILLEMYMPLKKYLLKLHSTELTGERTTIYYNSVTNQSTSFEVSFQGLELTTIEDKDAIEYFFRAPYVRTISIETIPDGLVYISKSEINEECVNLNGLIGYKVSKIRATLEMEALDYDDLTPKGG